MSYSHLPAVTTTLSEFYPESSAGEVQQRRSCPHVDADAHVSWRLGMMLL